MHKITFVCIWILVFIAPQLQCLSDDLKSERQLFRDEIVPLLVQKCFLCHGGESTEGGYSVADTSRLFQAGDSEVAPITTTEVASSELLRRLVTDDKTIRMPLDADPIGKPQIDAVRRWIASGAKVDDVSKSAPLIDLYAQSKSGTMAPEHYPRPIPISAILLSKDGELLLVGGYSEIMIWNVQRQLLEARLPTRGRVINDLEWAADGRLMVASGIPGEFGVLEEIDFAKKKPSLAFGFSRDICSDLAVNPSGDEIAAGFADGSIRIFSIESHQARASSVPHAAGITSVAWAGENNRILTSSRDRTAKSFDATDGSVLSAYPDHERTVGSVVNTSLGPITLDETGALRLWKKIDDANSASENKGSIAKKDGLPQRVQRMVTSNDVVFVPDLARVRRIYIFQEEVDDEKDNDKEKETAEKGKAKKKKRTSFKEHDALRSIPGRTILSMTANDSGFVAAGLDNGQVVVWRVDESTDPFQTWSAIP